MAIPKNEGFSARLFLSPPLSPVLLQTGEYHLSFIFFRTLTLSLLSFRSSSGFLHAVCSLTDLSTQMSVKYFADLGQWGKPPSFSSLHALCGSRQGRDGFLTGVTAQKQQDTFRPVVLLLCCGCTTGVWFPTRLSPASLWARICATIIKEGGSAPTREASF